MKNTSNYLYLKLEGDYKENEIYNITITSDFINNVENLETFLQRIIKNNNELNDNQEILLKTIRLILKEIDD